MENIKKCWDIHLVAFFLSKGHLEVNRPKREAQSVFFYFEDSPELEDLALEFYTGHPMVDARVYTDNIKRLRIIVGELRRGKAGARNE